MALGVGAEEIEEPRSTSYRIRSVIINAEGRTRPAVLRQILDISEGQTFSSREKLRMYLEDRAQVLRNQRPLAESSIIPAFHPSETDPSLILVDVKVTTRDSMNLISLPYAKYDQNIGLMFGLRGRDYNFLGGMKTLELNLDVIQRDIADTGRTSGNAYRLDTVLDIPVYDWGGNWRLVFDGDLTYNPDGPLQTNAAASLDFAYPLQLLTLHSSLTQEFHRFGDDWEDPDIYYLRTVYTLGSSIPTLVQLPISGEIIYEPEVFIAVNYKPGSSLSEERRGYEAGFLHSLTAGRIDWIGNFRSGTLLNLNQTLAYNMLLERWRIDYSGEYQFYSQWHWGGFSGRAGFFLQSRSSNELAGELLRGILDRRVQGDMGFYTNAALPLRVPALIINHWFEVQLSPFFDFGLVRPKGEALDLGDSWYGTGIDLYGFARFARSLYVRISLGVDAEAMVTSGLGKPAPQDGRTPFEIFIGMEHHF